MLSRIAESLFWIGRYVERADGTARILDVHLEGLNQALPSEQRHMSANLMGVMGVEWDQPTAELSDVLDLLAFNQNLSTSLAGALGSARENARRARESVSSGLWECLNATWYGLSQHRRDIMGTYRFCHWVVERTSMANGLSDTTMSHDEGWLFLKLGRSLERADMTARMLATREIVSGGLPWVTMLRCAGAYEAFLRSQRGAFSDENAAEFLLLDRLFPRSVIYALADAEDCLSRLQPGHQRVGFADDARRIVGQARTFLEFHQPTDLLNELPEHMERVQIACADASNAISKRYFLQSQTNSWSEEG